MNKPVEHMNVSVGAEGVDVEKLVREIHGEVDRKRREGVYADARIGRAERHNVMDFADSGELLSFYLKTLRDGGVTVDINEFTIEDRRSGPVGRLLVAFKTVIWKLLKFYTYRMWQQQNLVNGLMVTAIESSMKNYQQQIDALEKRVAELEKDSRA